MKALFPCKIAISIGMTTIGAGQNGELEPLFHRADDGVRGDAEMLV